MSAFQRVEQLIGKNNADKLSNATVAIFGLGGVGGFTAEALARSGVGNFILVDNDVVEVSNLNRQIIATVDTVGELKTDVMKDRILSINPLANVKTYATFYLPETANEIDLSGVDYIVDAVDTVTAKIHIIKSAKENNVPVITSMGTAGKTDITALKIDLVEKTSVCPLAKVVRRELKALNITGVKAVYSLEETTAKVVDENAKKHTPPSMIFVPATAGLMMAEQVVEDLTK